MSVGYSEPDPTPDKQHNGQMQSQKLKDFVSEPKSTFRGDQAVYIIELIQRLSCDCVDCYDGFCATNLRGLPGDSL